MSTMSKREQQEILNSVAQLLDNITPYGVHPTPEIVDTNTRIVIHAKTNDIHSVNLSDLDALHGVKMNLAECEAEITFETVCDGEDMRITLSQNSLRNGEQLLKFHRDSTNRGNKYVFVNKYNNEIRLSPNTTVSELQNRL